MDAIARVRFLEDRQRVLSNALRGFAEATTDYEALLDVVAKTLAAVVNDGCVVRLLGSDGWLSPVAMDLPFHLRVNEPEAIARLSASATRARSTCC